MKRKDSEKQKHWRGYEDFDKDVQTLPELSQLLEYHYLESRLAKAIDPKKNAAWVKATHKDHQRAQKRFMKLSRDKWEMAKRAGWIIATPTGTKLLTTMFTDFDDYAVGIARKISEDNSALPPPPEEFDKLWGWCRDAQKTLDAGTVAETEHTAPLSWTKWADVFGISRAALRKIRDAEKPIYHFRKTRENSRKWTLPLHELPAEYLEKYRKTTDLL